MSLSSVYVALFFFCGLAALGAPVQFGERYARVGGLSITPSCAGPSAAALTNLTAWGWDVKNAVIPPMQVCVSVPEGGRSGCESEEKVEKATATLQMVLHPTRSSESPAINLDFGYLNGTDVEETVCHTFTSCELLGADWDKIHVAHLLRDPESILFYAKVEFDTFGAPEAWISAQSLSYNSAAADGRSVTLANKGRSAALYRIGTQCPNADCLGGATLQPTANVEQTVEYLKKADEMDTLPECRTTKFPSDSDTSVVTTFVAEEPCDACAWTLQYAKDLLPL